MIVFDRLPLTALLTFCRAVRHGLSAGLSLVDVFRQQGRRGPPPIRTVAQRVGERLASGESLEDALAPYRHRFPPLFYDLTSVGEHTGRLPEVFEELERYFELQVSMRRQFITAISWPAFEFVGALVVISLLMMILPLVNAAYDPLGFGTGFTAVLRFWLCIGMFFALVLATYMIITRVLNQGERFHRVILKIPALGPTLESLALVRFSMAMHATWEAGLRVKHALVSSLRATGNPAFIAQEPKIAPAVKRGEEVVTILTHCEVFPPEFLDVVATGEESGRLPEVMSQQVKVYREETERRLKFLTRAAGRTVYLLIGVFIVFLIFRIMTNAMGFGAMDPETSRFVNDALPGL
jgi:type II secretory pathway component PulF